MNKGKLVKVTFEPDGSVASVPAGTLLSVVAAAAGKSVETPCGGIGVCGKCRVLVNGLVSKPDSTELRLISPEELESGVRLACRCKVMGDAHITIPETSRSLVQKILSDGQLRDCCLLPDIRKIYCELAPPSLDDERAEFERLSDHLAQYQPDVAPNLDIIRNMSSVMKSAEYKVTAVLYGRELIGVEAGDSTSDSYGIAYDLGSTTVVGYLMDLNTGSDIAVSAVMNPQMMYGDDLIARISFASTSENGLETLHNSAVDAFNRIAADLASKAGVSLKNIYKVTVVGNTCMTHLLLGIDPSSLGQSPYVPSICRDITVGACDLGLEIHGQAPVIVLPAVAGFVGSDLVGVLLSSMPESSDKTRLAVDIGTNGEMALRHGGKTYVCSAAAGPAFEGAGISCGMRGGPGAIDSVVIGDELKISTINGRKPLGICGSGLVDAVAQMLDAGMVDETGRLLSNADVENLPQAIRDRLIETDNGVEFVLADKKESGTGKPITLKHSDIRRLQLAKGSIHAAIQTLISHAGSSDDELDNIFLAGAFGNYIRVSSAIRIGLIPDIEENRIISVGNAAGAGARLALLCKNEMHLARRLAEEAIHIELAVSPGYQMELMERMMFPSQK